MLGIATNGLRFDPSRATDEQLEGCAWLVERRAVKVGRKGHERSQNHARHPHCRDTQKGLASAHQLEGSQGQLGQHSIRMNVHRPEHGHRVDPRLVLQQRCRCVVVRRSQWPYADRRHEQRRQLVRLLSTWRDASRQRRLVLHAGRCPRSRMGSEKSVGVYAGVQCLRRHGSFSRHRRVHREPMTRRQPAWSP